MKLCIVTDQPGERASYFDEHRLIAKTAGTRKRHRATPMLSPTSPTHQKSVSSRCTRSRATGAPPVVVFDSRNGFADGFDRRAERSVLCSEQDEPSAFSGVATISCMDHRIRPRRRVGRSPFVLIVCKTPRGQLARVFEGPILGELNRGPCVPPNGSLRVCGRRRTTPGFFAAMENSTYRDPDRRGDRRSTNWIGATTSTPQVFRQFAPQSDSARHLDAGIGPNIARQRIPRRSNVRCCKPRRLEGTRRSCLLRVCLRSNGLPSRAMGVAHASRRVFSGS
jgi:hypothetical protein